MTHIPHSIAKSPNTSIDSVETQISEVGQDLSASLMRVLEHVPGSQSGPQALATSLGVDKVLTSRLLKAMRSRDPIAVVHHAPGPEPLRRVLRAASKLGVEQSLISDATNAINRFDLLIKNYAGDRSGLDAIISAWLPEARRDFELRRKQSAFRAMSQLRGAMLKMNLSTVMLCPSDDGEHIDVVWVMGLLGLQRLRPFERVKFTTRKLENITKPRCPLTLGGQELSNLEDARLDEFCDNPPAEFDILRTGNAIHYLLAGQAFGPNTSADFVMAEVNRREIKRIQAVDGRKTHVFAEVETPTNLLVFDVLVHKDLFVGNPPELLIYDTSSEGIANPNDPTRDIDKYDMMESIQIISESGVDSLRLAGFTRYIELLRKVFSNVGWNESEFRTYRTCIEYPIYGSQISVAFKSSSH